MKRFRLNEITVSGRYVIGELVRAFSRASISR